MNEKSLSRDLTFERLYNLGNYSNITMKSTLSDIPEKLALNSDLMGKIYYLQMIEVERAFRKYTEFYAKLKTFSLEQYAEAMTVLEQEKEETMAEIKKLFADI